jgi:hypothetical protein
MQRRSNDIARVVSHERKEVGIAFARLGKVHQETDDSEVLRQVTIRRPPTNCMALACIWGMSSYPGRRDAVGYAQESPSVHSVPSRRRARAQRSATSFMLHPREKARSSRGKDSYHSHSAPDDSALVPRIEYIACRAPDVRGSKALSTDSVVGRRVILRSIQIGDGKGRSY